MSVVKMFITIPKIENLHAPNRGQVVWRRVLASQISVLTCDILDQLLRPGLEALAVRAEYYLVGSVEAERLGRETTVVLGGVGVEAAGRAELHERMVTVSESLAGVVV